MNEDNKYKLSIVFDLDDTICFPNHEKRDTYSKYYLAKPNTPVIRKMQEVQKRGYYIIIHSARRVVTHNGDTAKIEEDVAEITRKWLDEYNVPFNELIFGKPYATAAYVDDKAMSIDEFLIQ